MFETSKEIYRAQLKSTIKFGYQLLRSGLVTSIFLLVQSALLIRAYDVEQTMEQNTKLITPDLYQASVVGFVMGATMFFISIFDWITYFLSVKGNPSVLVRSVRSLIINYANYLGWFNHLTIAYTIGLSIATIVIIGPSDIFNIRIYAFRIAIASLAWAGINITFFLGFLINYYRYGNPVAFLAV